MFKDENRHYSLRKLSVGLASVLIGISFVSGNSHTVKADTVKDGSNGAQTIVQTTAKGSNILVKSRNAAIEANAKDDADTVAKANAEFTPKEPSQTPEVTKKNSDTITQDIRQKAVKASEVAIKVQNNTVKDNSDETALNVKGRKAIAANMPKEGKTEVKENQDWTDPAKNKLQMSTLKATTNKKLNAKMLAVSKVVSQTNDTNGGFDSSWGKLDVNDWKGSVQGDYYQLTDYTGNANHVIVPNEADFEKAGISTSGKQVGVTSNLMHTIFTNKATAQDVTVAFSKTDNKQVKAIDEDWSHTWEHLSDDNQPAKLSKFDGTDLNVSNVTNMDDMFSGNQISDLSSLAKWDVSHVTDMNDIFGSNQISNLSPLAKWNTGNVINMTNMFSGNQISDLSPLAKWNVSNVTSMTAMFSDNQISDLSPLAKWDVSHVTDMGEMFRNNQISDLSPLVNWKVDKVTNMSYMFSGNQISDVSPLDNWKVNNMIDMFGIFDGNISSIPLNTVKAKRIINFVYPAGYTGKKQGPVTQIVDVPTKQARVELTTNYSRPAPKVSAWVTKAVSAWVTKTETPETETPGPVYFKDYTVLEIKGLLEPDKTVISKQQADINKPINVTVTYKSFDSNTNDAFALDSKHGLHEHANVNDNGGYNEDFWGKINVDDWNYTVNNDKIEINGLKDGVSTGANDAVIVPNLDDFKLTGKYRDAKAVYLSKDALSKTAKHKYYGLSKTNGNKFVTDSNVNSAFKDDSNLTHADLNSLNTSNITDMTYMFNGASGLTSLDVSNWDTGNVTDMSNMFNGASSLTSLDVSNWETGNVTNMYAMFSDASSLTSLDVSKWNTGNVTDMGLTFNGDSSLTSLDVSNWDTSKVTNMSLMFNNCKNKNLTSVGDLSNWDTSKVTNMSMMFNGASSLTSLDVSKWDTSKVTNMSMMFNGDSSLTILDVSNWNTGNVTNMSLMFNGDSSLTSLDVSKWNTSKVTNMSLMFNNCKSKNLTSVGDLSNWDTSKVTNMSMMFNGASSLTSLDVSNWNTGNVTNMSMMFNGDSSLTSLDVSKWDTSKVTNMSLMFNGDSSLTSLDVSKWDTSNVINMSMMFNNCKNLTSVSDLSNWDTSKVTNMGLMFSSDPKLALIVNGDKFADYLVKNNFAGSNIDSGVKSVTTDDTKLLKLLTDDVQHNSATRTIGFTFPANYSPDLAKYHLTKTGNTYQIKQSVDYDKPYLQGTVLINAIYDITEHHIDTTKPNKLSDTWLPNYDKLVLAHKNADGTVSFDKLQLPKVPGYKAKVTRNNGLLMVNYLVFAPEKPATNNNLNELQFSNKLATNSTIQFNSTVKSNIVVKSDMYQVVNNDYNWQLPVIKNYDLKFATNKNQIIFAYTKDKQYNYRFILTLKDGQYRLTTFDTQGKLLKTYSIKSYKKLVKIIHSLVSMNIA